MSDNVRENILNRTDELVSNLGERKRAFDEATEYAAQTRANGDATLADAKARADEEIKEVRDRTAAQLAQVKESVASANEEANAVLADARETYAQEFDAALDTGYVTPIILGQYNIARPGGTGRGRGRKG